MVNLSLTRKPGKTHGEREVFSVNSAGETGYPHEKSMKLNPYTIHKIN